jgi:hypothetical protein
MFSFSCSIHFPRMPGGGGDESFNKKKHQFVHNTLSGTAVRLLVIFI